MDAIQACYRHPYTVLLRSDISTMTITPYKRRTAKPYSHEIKTGGQKSRVENTGFTASQMLSSYDYHRSAIISSNNAHKITQSREREGQQHVRPYSTSIATLALRRAGWKVT